MCWPASLDFLGDISQSQNIIFHDLSNGAFLFSWGLLRDACILPQGERALGPLVLCVMIFL